jgi:hypothetical protein
MKKLLYVYFTNIFNGLCLKFIRLLLDYSYVFGHYLIGYIYVCLYIQIAIKLLGFSVKEFALQASDISSTWYFFKYDLFSDFYSKASTYFYRIELYSISDGLTIITELDFLLSFSVNLFPYFMHFITIF